MAATQEAPGPHRRWAALRAWLSAPVIRRRRRRAESGHLADLMAKEERAGLTLLLIGRTVVLAVLAAWFAYSIVWERAVVYLAVVGVFMALGFGSYYLLRTRRHGMIWVGLFLLIDVSLLTCIALMPNPLLEDNWPQQINLRFWGPLYLATIVAALSLTYSPLLVLWVGVACALAWSAGFLWIATLPDSVVISARQVLDDNDLDLEGRLAIFLDPHSVSLTMWQNEIIVLLLITGLLAAAVWRSRRLVRREVRAEAARASLARYFSPNIVERLAGAEEELDRGSNQTVTVVFVDIVGFTALSERMAPEQVIALLRGFHGRVAGTIFAHEGTLDKYIGDSVMATFGTPVTGPNDATRALACALAIVDEVTRWNEDRAIRGDPPVRIGLGAHTGAAVVGNVGDEHRLEYTVIGDTVNVASRLERLTRETGAEIVVSGDLVDAVSRESPEGASLIEALREESEVQVRGRAAPVTIWTYRPQAAPIGELAAT